MSSGTNSNLSSWATTNFNASGISSMSIFIQVVSCGTTNAIIRVKIDKQNNNKFSFKSGSLESYMINDVVNVLEGTKNSFDIRNNKYDLGG